MPFSVSDHASLRPQRPHGGLSVTDSRSAALQVPPDPQQLRNTKAVHERALADGWGRVQMPDALDRKYPNAPADRRWQWVFPQEHRWKNTRTGEEGCHCLHETILQRAVKEAVRKARIVKHVGCHTFRHSGVYPALERDHTPSQRRL